MKSFEKIERGFLERMGRLSRLKLLIPLRRSPHSPEHSARGVAVGMFWALTPLVGIQMYLCFVTWLVAKLVPNLRFSLVISCAWTWISNVFTMLPMYYGFYVTGQIMLGRWQDITGYDRFLGSWHIAFSAGNGLWQATLELIALLARELGVSMMIGCLPYAIVGGWISYHVSLKYTRRRRRRLTEKRIQKAQEEAAQAAHAPDRPSA